jgi:hypothetical protein
MSQLPNFFWAQTLIYLHLLTWEASVYILVYLFIYIIILGGSILGMLPKVGDDPT